MYDVYRVAGLAMIQISEMNARIATLEQENAALRQQIDEAKAAPEAKKQPARRARTAKK